MKKFYIFLLPILSGILLGLIFYKLLPAFLVFFALVPLIFFIDKVESKRSAFVGGFVVGFIFFIFNLHTLAFIDWFGFITSETFFMHVLYVIFSIVAGFFYGLFAVLAKYVWKRSYTMLVVLPAIFVVAEFLKSLASYGFSWGFLGYLTDGMSLVVQGATLAGVLGLGFLIIFANTGITLALFHILEKRNEKKILERIQPAVYMLGIVIIGVGIFILLGQAVEKFILYRDGASVRVAVMQTSNQRASMALHTGTYPTIFKNAEDKGADIIVMPESLLDPKQQELSLTSVEKIISNFAGGFKGTIAVGGFRNEGKNTYNSFFLWHDGKIESVYDKHFLVPFAEYKPALAPYVAPFGSVLYTPGNATQHIQAGGVNLGVLICQEAIYPEAAATPVRNGAELLIVGANDGFVKDSGILKYLAPSKDSWLSRIQDMYAKFRAVENGRYLARSTKLGIASIFDPKGNELIGLHNGIIGERVSDVYLMKGITPYTRFGDLPILLFSFGCVCFMVWKRYKMEGIYYEQK